MSTASPAPPSGPETPVREVMHRGLVDCAPQTPMREVARLMAEGQIHCVVIDGLARGPRASERLVWGVVSDLDLANAVASDRLSNQAVEFAATEPVVVGSDEDVQCAARLMAEHACTHLIVTDEQTARPVGVISSLDLARALGSTDGSRADGRPR